MAGALDTPTERLLWLLLPLASAWLPEPVAPVVTTAAAADSFSLQINKGGGLMRFAGLSALGLLLMLLFLMSVLATAV